MWWAGGGGGGEEPIKSAVRTGCGFSPNVIETLLEIPLGRSPFVTNLSVLSMFIKGNEEEIMPNKLQHILGFPKRYVSWKEHHFFWLKYDVSRHRHEGRREGGGEQDRKSKTLPPVNNSKTEALLEVRTPSVSNGATGSGGIGCASPLNPHLYS